MQPNKCLYVSERQVLSGQVSTGTVDLPESGLAPLQSSFSWRVLGLRVFTPWTLLYPCYVRQCGAGTWRRGWGSSPISTNSNCVPASEQVNPREPFCSWFQIGWSCRYVGRCKRKHLPNKSYHWKAIQVLFSPRFILYFLKSQDGGTSSFLPTHFLSWSLPSCLHTRMTPPVCSQIAIHPLGVSS